MKADDPVFRFLPAVRAAFERVGLGDDLSIVELLADSYKTVFEMLGTMEDMARQNGNAKQELVVAGAKRVLLDKHAKRGFCGSFWFDDGSWKHGSERQQQRCQCGPGSFTIEQAKQYVPRRLPPGWETVIRCNQCGAAAWASWDQNAESPTELLRRVWFIS